MEAVAAGEYARLSVADARRFLPHLILAAPFSAAAAELCGAFPAESARLRALAADQDIGHQVSFFCRSYPPSCERL